VCHENVKFILGSNARFLIGRLARAMTTNVIFHKFKLNIIVYHVRANIFKCQLLLAIDDP